jgi:AP-4 complex subunit epsilon-1
VSGDSIPAVLPQVVDLLGHSTDLVRKKAVMVLHRFYQRAPATVAHLLPRFRQMLCDKARRGAPSRRA